jgi:Protein of unknown function (DUF3309)
VSRACSVVKNRFEAACSFEPPLLYGSSARDELDEQYNQRKHEQYVNESSQRVRRNHPQQPQHKKNDKDCPKHRSPPADSPSKHPSTPRILQRLFAALRAKKNLHAQPAGRALHPPAWSRQCASLLTCYSPVQRGRRDRVQPCRRAPHHSKGLRMLAARAPLGRTAVLLIIILILLIFGFGYGGYRVGPGWGYYGGGGISLILVIVLILLLLRVI